jgi:thiamine pyrophosphate-dependent acetolactate synthase large subunit-like protein
VAEAISGQPWTLANGVFGGWARRNLRFQEPDQFLGRSGGEGLGYGAGAAIGAALAYKGSGRLVLDLQADGDLLYTPQAMWTAAHHEIPLLMIVDGNRTYSKDELHQRVIAKERGRPVTHASRGIVFDAPAIDHAAMARSMGVWASGPIADLAALLVALTEAIGVVRGGQPAVLEVRTSPVDG